MWSTDYDELIQYPDVAVCSLTCERAPSFDLTLVRVCYVQKSVALISAMWSRRACGLADDRAALWRPSTLCSTLARERSYFFVPLVARALTMPLVTRHPRVVRSLIGRRDTSRRKRCALALLHTCHPHLSSHPAHTTLLPYYLTTSLPHYLTTLLPYYLTTFVPYYCTYYCITFIPHYLTTLLPYYLTAFAFVPRCART